MVKVVPTGIIPAIPGTGKDKAPFPLRGDVIAALGELIGMTIFIFLALSGVQAALNAPSGSGDKVPANAGPTFRYSMGHHLNHFAHNSFITSRFNPFIFTCNLVAKFKVLRSASVHQSLSVSLFVHPSLEVH